MNDYYLKKNNPTKKQENKGREKEREKHIIKT